MTSFLTDVLITAGKLEKIDLNEKIVDIQKEVMKLKYDVKEFMNDNYVEFLPKLKKDQALVIKADKLIEEINNLQKRVDDQIKIELSGSTRELKNLSNDLKESSISLKLSSQLLELHKCLNSIEKLKEDKRYVDAAKTLRYMQALLDDPNSHLQSLDIFHPIKNEYCMSCGTFLTDVTSLWQQYIHWEEIEESSTQACTKLNVKCEFEDIQDLIRALHYVDNLSNCLNNLSTKLMKHLITPIISYECSVYVIEEKIFVVKPLNKKRKPIYKSVLYNLRLLFQFLHQHLNVAVEDNQTFFNKLQLYLFEQLSDSLIKNCVSNTIPSSSTELKNFGPVMDDINEFQNYLVEIGFISNDQLFLSEYTKNIDNLFIDKICQDLLAKARVIMKKDLHDCVKYEPKELPTFPKEVLEDYDLKINRKLSKVIFELPPCQISKSVKEILHLARDILDEACCSSEVCAVKLFYTSRNVFEMYAGLVAEHHKSFLETIPQQVDHTIEHYIAWLSLALFHNNCMYLAHHLLTLAHEYRDRLPNILRKHNLTYADQTLVLRTVGSECLLEHMKYQRNIIIDILRDSGLSVLGQTPELPPSTERAMRQCIRQLELLKTVWINILPVNIYCKAIGCIMNSMVEDLVAKVVSVEDIPADVALELVALFDMIIKRTPSVFPDPNMVQRNVRKWGKLTELVKVLGASLKEIDDRWADGKGPLAHEFTATQVKQLIRALFQNTERRAALLATIK